MSVENEISLSGADEKTESVEGELPENWKEIIEAYNLQASREAMEETLASDPVAQKCEYRRFVSGSNGRNRRRRRQRLVELLGYEGRYHSLKGDNAYGKIDEIAADVLRDIVEPDMAVQTFLTRLRGLNKSK